MDLQKTASKRASEASEKLLESLGKAPGDRARGGALPPEPTSWTPPRSEVPGVFRNLNVTGSYKEQQAQLKMKAIMQDSQRTLRAVCKYFNKEMRLTGEVKMQSL